MRVDRFLNRRSTIYTVTSSGDVDEYGNPEDGTPTARSALCFFEPWSRQTAGGEANVDRATTTDDWRYVVAAGTNLESVDYVTIDGESGTFEVVGEPVSEWNPLTASPAFVTARLRRSQR
jgi:hypothetical protein